MTKPRRLEFLLLAAVLWLAAVAADWYDWGDFVESAFWIAGILAVVLSFLPEPEA